MQAIKGFALLTGLKEVTCQVQNPFLLFCVQLLCCLHFNSLKMLFTGGTAIPIT